VLLGENIVKFLEKYVKINPAGVDLSPKAIFRVPIEKIDYAILDREKRGYIINNEFKNLIEVLEKIEPKNNYWELESGIYYLVFPRIKIPLDCIALAFPRSTLNRLGLIKSETAVFDPGYEGEFTQTWYIPIKFKININEAWIQIIFIKLEKEAKEGYKGFWQKETYSNTASKTI